LIEITEKPNVVERAFLIGLRRGQMTQAEAEEHLDELAQLADTMGVPVVGREVVTIARIHPALLIGTGKAQQIKEQCEALEADVIIFDDDLSPSQQRNWEKMTDIAVIDRREVILDIFAQRARTHEARLQVQLARLEYSLPRLRRAWTHLERQRGGTGARGGAGEMQLETDRRIVVNQIASIKRQLSELRRRRATQRKQRVVKPTPTASIVGYTNAGKSTLLKRLTGADILVEDKLFATLDPTTRRIQLPNQQELLLTDTVGFIRKLPHDLVASFRATLEETAHADILIHVVDASHPSAMQQIQATKIVLEEIGAVDKPTVVVLNKTDRPQAHLQNYEVGDGAERVVRISAATGQGIEALLDALVELLPTKIERLKLEIPHDRHDLIAMVHREGHVNAESYSDSAVQIDVELPQRLHHHVQQFVTHLANKH